MKAKVFLLALLIMNVFQMSAQNSDEVTLVVSAVGATTEDATKTALRNAIEQAYGTFVSANTTILNDELVKDEIVTIANGNIKNYKEIANTTLADGRVSVTLQAIVSISKLVSYAQSKGASTEFAGATFAMNMKMKELNKKNEIAALENLLVQVKQMLPYAFDRRLVIGTPKEPDLAKLLENPAEDNFQDLLNVLKSIAINNGTNIKALREINGLGNYYFFNDKVAEVIKLGGEPTKRLYSFIKNSSNYYEIPAEIILENNGNTQSCFNLIFNTLQSLALTEDERNEMDKQNMKYSEKKILCFLNTGNNEIEKDFFYFRNPDEYIDDWGVRLRAIILNELSDFVMTDNLGGKAYFKDANMLSFIEEGLELNGWTLEKEERKKHNYNFRNLYGAKYHELHYRGRGEHVTNGTGLFSPIVLFRYSHISDTTSGGPGLNELLDFSKEKLSLEFSFYIPKDKIMEYNNFSLERRTN